MSDESLIAELVTSIHREFLLCMEQRSLMHEKWAEVRMSDFNLWVAGVGATAGKKASLDARLQTMPDELSTLKHLLSSLKKSLIDCRGFYGNELETSMEVVDLIIENLAMLATVIRRTGKRSRLRRADQTFNPQRQTRLRQHFECIVLLRPTKDALFRPVSQPTSAEDWMSVVPKFAAGRGNLTPLQTRLINANLRRRYWFLCAQRHSEKLAGPQSPVTPQASTIPKASPTALPVEDGVSRYPVALYSKPASSHAVKDTDKKATLPDLSTVASTVESTATSAKGKASAAEFSRTKITAITASAQYPTLKKLGDNDLKKRKILKCPCCCQSQPATMAEDTNTWKRHLVEDIRPYTCIADDCPTPHILYCTRLDWENHVKTDHPPNRWACPICNHPIAIFSELESLVRHVQGQHADILPMDTIQTILHWGAIKSYGLTCCPLCDSSGPLDSPELIDHVLQHTHDFALRSLPWPKHKAHGQSPLGSYNLETPYAKTIKSWLDDICDESTDPVRVKLDLRSCDAVTQDPSEAVGFDYFEKNDYFADASSRLSLATLSQRSNVFSHTEAEMGLQENIDPSMELAEISIAHGAAFDSHVYQRGHECLPGTRTDLLRQITEWARSPQGKCIFWLNGMAGTGKSTISRTVAKSFSQNRLLGASFFFERGEGDRGKALKFFPTIATQLAISIPQMVPALQKIVRDDPGITVRAMREQFEKLLLQPIQSLEKSGHPIQTMVIVIDALDECEGDSDIRLIVQLLLQLQRSNTVRLRVFLTSRPELPIRLGFSGIATHDYEDLILHEIPEEIIGHDVLLFLNHRLSEIRTERTLPIDWPGDTNLRKLVALSVPLFIFATTVCRIFEDPYWDPDDSLAEILAHQYDGSMLDQTYLPVLNRLLKGQNEKRKKQLVQEFQQVVGSMLILESPLSVVSLSGLLSLPKRQIRLRLSPLHSVLSVPNDENVPVRLFHPSFRDFLLDPETREKTLLWVDEKATHYRLTVQCLLTCQKLRKNICELPSYGTQRADIDRQAIDHHLSVELQYACRYWATHLVQCIDISDAMHSALLFLQTHFLHWVEAMSILDHVSEVVVILNILLKVIPENHQSAMSDFLYDAKRFILKNRRITDDVPLQLYCSGLLFAPRTSIIREKFKHELPAWISKLPQVDERWSAELQALEGQSGPSGSVAFSADGRLLKPGCSDKNGRLWDDVTGALQQKFMDHSCPIRSVAFSPDCRLLATASDDQKVRLWDSATGALTQTLEGHSASVRSVAFSPDGHLLASASDDQTVNLWDAATGKHIQTRKGHSASVQSVAFSPDGRLLASASDDQTVQLWDTATSALMQTLEGHSASVRSVAFSPDGRLLASASDDQTVRLWDSAIGALTQTPKGHSASVRSVAFSADGRLLASASDDQTVRLWDSATGALTQTLEGHSASVRLVTFSPDGRLLASGSSDHTVRLWDTAFGVLRQTWPMERMVTNLEFSRDGSCLNTDLGDFDVQSRCDPPTFKSPHLNLKISIEHDRWIKLDSEKILWLPTGSRPSCFAINGSILALGHASGRVSFIGFHI